ncbi:MAG: hypothetical protein IKL82_01410 [Clostridia bacterium]|nr:hypothetical protein [Clostridia bacterium]
MKSYAKIISFVITLIMLFTLASCEKVNYGYTHPTYTSEYTSQQHIERIKNVYLNKSEAKNGTWIINDINVEIINSFYDNDPEYFIVEMDIRIGKIIEGYFKYRDAYLVIFGFIWNDEYYYGYTLKSNPYKVCGYEDNKKFVSNYTFGIEEDGKVYKIAEVKLLADLPSYTVLEKQEITLEEQKQLMENGGYNFSRKKLTRTDWYIKF